MAEYEERFRKFLDEGDWGSETNEDGTLLVASLFPIELFINLTRELVNEDYTNATKEQLEWAIRTLLEERESDQAVLISQRTIICQKMTHYLSVRRS